MLRKLLLLAVVAASLAGSQVPQRRLVSLVVANGIVITVDGNRRVHLARLGRDRRPRHRGGRHGGGDCRRLSRPRDDRCRGRGRHARPDQHPHPCADGPLPRPGGRPGADGVAAEVHLPGRGEDRVAGVRPRRHAARRARDDRVGHDHLRRHVLLRGGDRPRHEGGRACAASSARRSSSFPSPTRRLRPKAWPGRSGSRRSSPATS